MQIEILNSFSTLSLLKENVESCTAGALESLGFLPEGTGGDCVSAYGISNVLLKLKELSVSPLRCSDNELISIIANRYPAGPADAIAKKIFVGV